MLKVFFKTLRCAEVMFIFIHNENTVNEGFQLILHHFRKVRLYESYGCSLRVTGVDTAVDIVHYVSNPNINLG